MSSPSIRTRRAVASDLGSIKRFTSGLWPREPEAEVMPHMEAIIAGVPMSTLPLVLFVAEVDGVVAGFIEVGLRSHADGCDGRYPVGFLEAWYVEPAYQRRSVGRALVAAAEEWARAQGAHEMASDTWQDNEGSQHAHAALGFEIVDRCVTFRKSIV